MIVQCRCGKDWELPDPADRTTTLYFRCDCKHHDSEMTPGFPHNVHVKDGRAPKVNVGAPGTAVYVEAVLGQSRHQKRRRHPVG